VKSTISAGVSMVAVMVYAIQQGLSCEEILKRCVVSGVATTMTKGTNLARQENINKVSKLMD